MRTIKVLGLAVAMAWTAVPVLAQGGLQPGAFPGIDRVARFEAQRLVRRERAQEFRNQRAHRMHVRAFAGARRLRAGAALRARPALRAALRAGVRVRIRASATPKQKALFHQFRAQRHAVRAQVRNGKLTREQAREQMRNWAREHRPVK